MGWDHQIGGVNPNCPASTVPQIILFLFFCCVCYSTNGHEHAMKCYDGLVLNPYENECQKEHDVPICAPGKNNPQTVYKAKEPFTCANLPDGLYPPKVVYCNCNT